MKNVVIAILAVIVIVVGYIAATSKLRLSLEGLEGKTEVVTRANLTIPINATGETCPDRRVVIKSEASGEVLDIMKQPGDRVRAGELLIKLLPEDEERKVRRAQLDLTVAKARLEEAKLNLEQAKTADLRAAEAQVAQIEASLRLSKLRADRAKEAPELFHDEEQVQRTTFYENQLAQLAAVKAALERAKLAIPRAEQAVKQSEATFESMKNNLDDAKKLLRETDIISPINGIVAQMRTQKGEVIQGGKTTLMGGTELAVVLDLQKLIVKAEVDEADIGRVLAIAPEWAKPGHAESEKMPEDLDAAAASLEHLPVITVESFRDEEFTGIIERIHPEPLTIGGVVTYQVDVVIISPTGGRLLPGMRADVRFTSEHAENVVLCPNEAIREGPGSKLGVYVPDETAPPEERKVKFVACKFGLDNGNYSEVREGLSEGAVVYIKLPAKRDRDRDDRKRRS